MTLSETCKDSAGSQGKDTEGEASCQWLRDEPQVSVRGLLEQGPAATRKFSISKEESQRKQYPSDQEERAQTLHLRQWRRQEGSATLIKEKEQRAEVLKTKDSRKRHPYPRSEPGSVEDCRKLWCDGKRQPTVQMCRLSQLGFLGYYWERPTVL